MPLLALVLGLAGTLAEVAGLEPVRLPDHAWIRLSWAAPKGQTPGGRP